MRLTSQVSRTLVCVVALACSVGCAATFAPLIRASQYGAPGRLSAGRLEFGGTAGLLTEASAGQQVADGPNLALAIRDWASVEAGANLSFFNGGRWAMGYVGARFTGAPDADQPLHPAFDFELGLGMGAGGERCSDNGASYTSRCPISDGLAWNDRFAIGAYQGFGLGYHFHWFALYLRVRAEESWAKDIPFTIWPSATLGGEFTISHAGGRVFSISSSGGYIGYSNRRETAHGVFCQLGLTIYFDVFVKEKRPTKEEGPDISVGPL